MPEFSAFDQRHYRTVPVREGYRAWQPTYEDTVDDAMDLALLDRITTVPWRATTQVADLGCGSGRTARWLVAQGVTDIDGVDVTPEMLDKARERGLHRRLVEADVRSTGLPGGAYDVAICALVDEHLPELGELYAEARRLLVAGGAFIVVGFHPFVIMAMGIPTHFDDVDGQPTTIETYVHLPSAHMGAARAAGFRAEELHEGVIDDGWIRLKPKWEANRGWPLSFAWVWRAA